MSDILDKLRAFYENAETDECLYDIRRAIEELERLYALPVFDGPPTWQEEVASVEDAFDRSGVKPTWPDDEPANIGPMAAAMADEIRRLTLTDEELDAIEHGLEQIELHSDLESRSSAKAISGLLDRLGNDECTA